MPTATKHAAAQMGTGELATPSGTGDARDAGSGSMNGDEHHPAADGGTFSEQMAKAKSVLTQPFVFTSLLYSLVISFSLSVRGNQMSLVNGRPVDSVAHAFMAGPDKWNTTAGAPAMQRYYSCFVPLTLTLATELYFFSYMSLSRYAADTKEWIILGVFSAFLICGSLNFIICPHIRQDQIVVTQHVHIV